MGAKAAAGTASNTATITEIVVAGPSWKGFTNRDGTGLYHEMLDAVFGLYGITIQRVYVPSERGLQLVREGRADFHTCYDYVDPPFILAKHPMFENEFHVLFSKQRIHPWKGMESLRGRSVTCRIGYYRAENFTVPVSMYPLKTSVAALDMVLLGRKDFYVDDISFIRDSLSKTTLKVDMEAFAIEPVGYRAYYPVFYPSPRGDRVRALYEEGMARLHASGALRAIFEKWGHGYPHYDDL